VCTVAKNSGSGQRKGAVKGRSQTKTSSGHYVKRDAITGKFLDVKADKSPFKGVRREK
jgi:hypothetical protein